MFRFGGGDTDGETNIADRLLLEDVAREEESAREYKYYFGKLGRMGRGNREWVMGTRREKYQ